MSDAPTAASAEPPAGHRQSRRRHPRRPTVWPTVVLGAFVLAWVLATGAVAAKVHYWTGPWRWLEAALALLACLGALAVLARRLPLQNVLTIGLISLIFSAGILGCSSVSGFPLGRITFSDRAGPLLFSHVPLWLPFYWTAIVLSSRDTARLVLLPWRRNRFYGFSVVGVAAVLTVIVALNWEPCAVQIKGQWSWPRAEGMEGHLPAPWFSFVSWAVSVVAVLGFSAPWFISKRPISVPPRFTVALVWALLNVHFIVANASHGLWRELAPGTALAACVLFLVWRGPRVAEQAPAPTGK